MMKNRVNKIEILNEKDFDRLIEEYDIEKFSCSGDKCSENDNIMRIAVYSDYDMFDELAEQLDESEYGFRLYGGIQKNINYTVFEIIT